MKNLFAAFLTCISFTASQAQISFNTGDTDFDADLNVVNTNANADLSAFKLDITTTFGTTSTVIDNMLSINMVPGEIYLAFEIAKAVSKPIDDVIVVYKKNKGKGWGVIAQEMGIKPGSDEFHALKGKTKNKKDKGNHGNGNGNGKNKN
jgi:hypothetical protein